MTAFTYAHALIRSHNEDVKIGITILEGLLKRDTEDIPKRDYVYYLAVAHTRIKVRLLYATLYMEFIFQEYDRALAYIDLLLNAESHNRQAIELKSAIEKRMKKDGLLGLVVLGLGGGVALAAGLIATTILRRH